MNIDLHCHSTASDGALPAEELVRRAAAQGVEVLALTDHDELAGLRTAREAAQAAGIRFVDGVEISVTWRAKTLHIVGLGVDAGSATLGAALATVRSGRIDRAQRMAKDLATVGIAGSFEGAMQRAKNPAMVSRTHFARFMVDTGVVADTKSAFRHYLTEGKPGYVPHQWAELSEAVGWIRDAGGQAVIAHPGRYGLSADALRDLLVEFRGLGGEGIEVITGSHSPDQYIEFARLAQAHGLLASRGSDFHGPGEGAELGRLPSLEPAWRPIWSNWAL